MAVACLERETGGVKGEGIQKSKSGFIFKVDLRLVIFGINGIVFGFERGGIAAIIGGGRPGFGGIGGNYRRVIFKTHPSKSGTHIVGQAIADRGNAGRHIYPAQIIAGRKRSLADGLQAIVEVNGIKLTIVISAVAQCLKTGGHFGKFDAAGIKGFVADACDSFRQRDILKG